MLVALLDEIIRHAAGGGCREIIMGMSHRGRLNVQVNVLRKLYETVFCEFEDNYDPHSLIGSGDVKYHKGYLAEGLGAQQNPSASFLPTSEPPRSRGPRGGRNRAGAPGAFWTRRDDPHPPAPHPRRCGLRRPGRGSGNPEPITPGRLPDGWYHPHSSEQPDRVHHFARGRAVHPLFDGRRQDAHGPHLSRPRGRLGSGPPRGGTRLRLPRGIRQGRGDRPGLLPPARPQ